jgi:hypothetical protein
MIRPWLGASSLAKNALKPTVLLASNGHDSSLSHAKWAISVSLFQHDANRKSLVKADPVQSLFNIWQATDGCAVLLK